MRMAIIKLASITTFFAALLSVAMGFGYMVGGSPGQGLLLWAFGTPALFGLAVVFDWVKNQMQLEYEDDNGIIDIESKRVFKKSDGG